MEDICAAVSQMKMPAVALTDINGVYGLVWFIQVAKEYGLFPLVGAEIRTVTERCVILAKNLTGFGTLCRAITARQIQAEFDLSQHLRADHAEIVILSDSIALLRRLKGVVAADHLYAELIPFGNREAVLKLARAEKIAPVAAGDVYFVQKTDWEVHRLLRAIDLNTTLKQIPPDQLASRELFLRSGAQMAALFADCPEAIENSGRIAQQIRFDLDFRGFIFPTFKGPKGEDAFSYLRDRVMRGAIWRYGKITAQVKGRLDYELTIIGDKGFAPYFLVMADVVQKAPRTCGRGSAAASIVSYCLGITHVDPIRYDLYFERFLHPDRSDPPDIDVDFPWDERDDILNYIFQKYPPGCVAMIANHVGFRARAAIREVAKVYGLPDADIGKITEKMSGYWQPAEIEQMIGQHPAFRHTDFPEPWPEILALAEKLEGFPRHLSVHCGGVVIATNGLSQYVPYENAKKQLVLKGVVKDGSTGLPTLEAYADKIQIVQWEKDQAETMGLVKMDILGNRSLAVIRDALRAIHRNYGIEINYTEWNPLADPKTLGLLAKGDTMGVFYVESPAMRLLQKKTGYGDFEHLVIHSSIIRPAANAYINEYIRRLKGGRWEPLHPLLENILNDTYGIMVYQEDISKVAIALAGFNAAEADLLRKVIPNKRKQKVLEQLEKKFIAGARDRGVAAETIGRIWQMFMSFSGYSFCKPHSASYALVSFKSAFLRAHYPAEFMAAVISNQGGFYTAFAYLSECRRMGLEIQPLDINKSEKHYTGNQNGIRIGFMQLKEIRAQAIDQLLNERKAHGAFRSLEDLVKRVTMEPSDYRILIKAGALDSISASRNRPQMMWFLEWWLAEKNALRLRPNLTLFDPSPVQKGAIPEVPDYDERTRLRHEQEVFGFLISCHPLALYQERIRGLDYVDGNALERHIGKTVRVLGWLITRKVARTKRDEMMEFMSFEDRTAIYETTFFPKVYYQFVHMMAQGRSFLLTGTVESQFGAVTLNVTHVAYL